MPYPSGSTLLVALQNGASPNTGPFDIYINSLSSSTNLIANDVSKATLSGSGYTFVTPLETFRVWAKSDSTITTADVAILGEVPGYNGSVRVTASYDMSLNGTNTTASVFLDCGYGLTSAGTIPAALNACPSTTGIGTGSINKTRNTLVVLKENETGSNLIKFFANSNPTSDYYYFIPSLTAAGGASTINICADLSSGDYQTVTTNSINVYPTASVSITSRTSLTGLFGFNDSFTYTQLKVNGNTIFSGSLDFDGDTYASQIFTVGVPGNALVEVTSSLIPQSAMGGQPYAATLQNNYYLTYKTDYNNSFITSSTTTNDTFTTSSSPLVQQYSLYSVPGGVYNLQNTGSLVGDPATANLVFSSYNGGLFTFNLSQVIPSTAITISAANVKGYTDVGCSSLDVDDNLGSNITIPGGTTAGQAMGYNPLDCTIYSYKKVNAIIVNGQSRSNGQTLTVGGTTVTVVINFTACNYYPC
jgi:hypothetical protein